MDIKKLIDRLNAHAADWAGDRYIKSDLREAADTLADLQSENGKLKSDNAYLLGQLMTIRHTDEPERCSILFRIETWPALRRGAVHDLADMVMGEVHRAIDEQWRGRR